MAHVPPLLLVPNSTLSYNRTIQSSYLSFSLSYSTSFIVFTAHRSSISKTSIWYCCSYRRTIVWQAFLAVFCWTPLSNSSQLEPLNFRFTWKTLILSSVWWVSVWSSSVLFWSAVCWPRCVWFKEQCIYGCDSGDSGREVVALSIYGVPLPYCPAAILGSVIISPSSFCSGRASRWDFGNGKLRIFCLKPIS